MVSMVIADFQKKWNEYPYSAEPGVPVAIPTFQQTIFDPNQFTFVTKAELEQLRGELEALKKLIPAVQEFDTATGQEDCEHEDKVAWVLKLADMLGVDFDDVLKCREKYST